MKLFIFEPYCCFYTGVILVIEETYERAVSRIRSEREQRNKFLPKEDPIKISDNGEDLKDDDYGTYDAQLLLTRTISVSSGEDIGVILDTFVEYY